MLTVNNIIIRYSPNVAIFFVQQFVAFVEPAAISTKGTDASGINDEEPPPEELEFSDDEKEAEAKRALKPSNRYGGCSLDIPKMIIAVIRGKVVIREIHAHYHQYDNHFVACIIYSVSLEW